MSLGRVYIVGAGPGAPELISVRGFRALLAADAVLIDRLLPRTFLDDLGLAGTGRSVRWLGDDPLRPTQPQINEWLVSQARAGRIVVRLKGGDPFVFARGEEEAAALSAAGIPVGGHSRGQRSDSRAHCKRLSSDATRSRTIVCGCHGPGCRRRCPECVSARRFVGDPDGRGLVGICCLAPDGRRLGTGHTGRRNRVGHRGLGTPHRGQANRHPPAGSAVWPGVARYPNPRRSGGAMPHGSAAADHLVYGPRSGRLPLARQLAALARAATGRRAMTDSTHCWPHCRVLQREASTG